MTRSRAHIAGADLATAAITVALAGILAAVGLPGVAGAAALALPVTLAARRSTRAGGCLR